MGFSCATHGQGIYNSMRVLIATGIYPPDIGGPATYTHRLRLWYQTNEVVCDVITYGDVEIVEEHNGVTVIPRQWPTWRKYLAYFWQIWKRRKQYDVVYAQDLVSSGIPSSLARKFGGPKLVIRLGGDFLWEKAFNSGWTTAPLTEYYDQPKTAQEKKYLTWFTRVLRRADHVVFSTQWQQELYQNVFGLQAEKTSVITNAFPEFQPPRETPNNTVLFAGRLIPLKNLIPTIDAVLQVPGLKMEIVGEGPEEQKVREHIVKRDAEDRITMLPAESHDQLQHRIARSWVVVVPSVSEVSPNVVMEAVAIGTPVVVTKHCGFAMQIPELRYVDPLSVASIAAALQELQDEGVYSEYSTTLQGVDVGRGWSAVGEDHDKLFHRV